MDTGYIDNMTRLVKDDLVSTIQAGDRVSVASSLFSMYAYRALQNSLRRLTSFDSSSLRRHLPRRKPRKNSASSTFRVLRESKVCMEPSWRSGCATS